MSQKVIIHIVKKQMINGDNVNCLESIRHPEDVVCFVFPMSQQTEHHHQELFKLPLIKNAVKSMTKIGHYRNLNISLNDELTKIYLDEECNFVFKDIYLEEDEIPRKIEKSNTENMSQSSLLEILNVLKDRDTSEFKLTDMEKKFAIEKFNGKQKAVNWLEVFEHECKRFKITTNEQKIKCLKLFLKDSAEEWYQSTMMKLPDNEWSKWSESFLAVFCDKGWSKVRYAYSFKYMSGSLIDYALKKERMILEVEKKMTDTSRINLIVVGLPLDIQDKLDREEISSTDELMNKLGRYEYGTKQRKQILKENKIQPEQKLNIQKSIEKKPCYICESLKFPGRYHPVEKCRNKDKYIQKRNVNMNEAVTSEFEDLAKLELDEEKN